MKKYPNWFVGLMIVIFYPANSKVRQTNRCYSRARANRREIGYKKHSSCVENDWYERAQNTLFPPEFFIELFDRARPGYALAWRRGELSLYRSRFREFIDSLGIDPMNITPAKADKMNERM